MWMLLIRVALAAPPLDAVVLVQQGSTTCAGAVVSAEGEVATAYHCVAAGGRPRITTRDGRTAIGRVVGAHPATDLAVIDVPDLAGTAWIPVAEGAPPPGTEIDVLGHPYGVRAPLGFMEGTLRWSVSRGVVSAVGPAAVQFDAPVNPGNSGGPVVDREGRLVAVVSRKSAGGEGLGFGGRAELVTGLLEGPRRGLSPVGGTAAISLLGSAYGGRGGIVSIGPLVELAFRDRVVLSGAWTLPPSARWDALRFGEVRWLGPEARLGLRQRLFRGPWTARLDAFGGVAGLTTLRGGVSDDEVDLERSATAVPIVGGAVQIGNGGFELSWTAEGDTRASLVLRWPGVVSVF